MAADETSPNKLRVRRVDEEVNRRVAKIAQSTNSSADRQRLVGRLAGGVAHDFNNLLATVLGCLELMERRTGDPERLQALIKRASDAVERAAGLTSGLVHFARRNEAVPHQLDLTETVRGIAPLLASALGRRIRFQTELAADTPRIKADQMLVESCLTALCLAARDVLPDGGEITLSASPATDAEVPTDAGKPARLGSVVKVRVTGGGAAEWDLELLARCAAGVNGLVQRSGPDSIAVFFPASGG